MQGRFRKSAKLYERLSKNYSDTASVIKNSHALVGTIWLAGALAFNGIPGTGTLRSLFLMFGLVHLAWVIRGRSERPSWPNHRSELNLLIILTVWFLVQSLFLSGTPSESLKAVFTHWGKILILIFMMAAFLAYSKDPKSTRNWMMLGAFLSSFFHVVATLGFQAWKLVAVGHFLVGESLLGNYGYISPYITMSLALLTAEIVARFGFNRDLLPFRLSAIWFFLFLTLCAEGLLAAKAGYVMSVIQLSLASAILIVICRGPRKIAAGLLSVILLGALATPLSFANRWKNFSEGLVSSIHQESNLSNTFVSSSVSELGIDPSIFVRYSLAKAGLEAVANKPMGYGYDSNGFGRFVEEKTGISGAVSSHSGWIDFTIDNGIPGLLILFLLTGVLLKRGLTVFLQSGNPASIALVLTVVNYMGRCAIDGHLVGSRFTGFALATAALWAASSVIDNENNPS